MFLFQIFLLLLTNQTIKCNRYRKFTIISRIRIFTQFLTKQKRLFLQASPDYVTEQFRKLWPNHKLYDLRHTFATKCLELNVNTKVVQLWLGTRVWIPRRIFSATLQMILINPKALKLNSSNKKTPVIR